MLYVKRVVGLAPAAGAKRKAPSIVSRWTSQTSASMRTMSWSVRTVKRFATAVDDEGERGELGKMGE